MIGKTPPTLKSIRQQATLRLKRAGHYFKALVLSKMEQPPFASSAPSQKDRLKLLEKYLSPEFSAINIIRKSSRKPIECRIALMIR